MEIKSDVTYNIPLFHTSAREKTEVEKGTK